jgi:hypothetical protein
LFLRVLDGGGIPGATGFPGGEWRAMRTLRLSTLFLRMPDGAIPGATGFPGGASRTFWDGRDALNKPPRLFGGAVGWVVFANPTYRWMAATARSRQDAAPTGRAARLPVAAMP